MTYSTTDLPRRHWLAKYLLLILGRDGAKQQEWEARIIGKDDKYRAIARADSLAQVLKELAGAVQLDYHAVQIEVLKSMATKSKVEFSRESGSMLSLNGIDLPCKLGTPTVTIQASIYVTIHGTCRAIIDMGKTTITCPEENSLYHSIQQISNLLTFHANRETNLAIASFTDENEPESQAALSLD